MTSQRSLPQPANRICIGLLLCNVVLAVSGGCGKADSGSDWLKPCDGADEECGADLECLCGVCTQGCESDAACSDLSPEARCTPKVSAPYADNCQAGEPRLICEGPAKSNTPLIGRPYDPRGCYGTPQLAGYNTWGTPCRDVESYAIDPQVNCWLFPTTCLPDGFINADINPLVNPIPCNRTNIECTSL